MVAGGAVGGDDDAGYRITRYRRCRGRRRRSRRRGDTRSRRRWRLRRTYSPSAGRLGWPAGWTSVVDGLIRACRIVGFAARARRPLRAALDLAGFSLPLHSPHAVTDLPPTAEGARLGRPFASPARRVCAAVSTAVAHGMRDG
jgi:hypothetical protein